MQYHLSLNLKLPQLRLLSCRLKNQRHQGGPQSPALDVLLPPNTLSSRITRSNIIFAPSLKITTSLSFAHPLATHKFIPNLLPPGQSNRPIQRDRQSPMPSPNHNHTKQHLTTCPPAATETVILPFHPGANTDTAIPRHNLEDDVKDGEGDGVILEG